MATEKRLIYVNALIERIKKRLKNEMIIGWLCSIVDEAPTVDAVEVVHGRWVFGTANHREYMKCSECLHSYTPDGTFCYCPNCGADMR